MTSHRPSGRLLAHAAALAALVTVAVVLGCRSTEKPTAKALFADGLVRVRAVVVQVVDDPERRTRALDLVDRYAEAERAFLDRSLEYREALAALHRDHATTPQQYDAELGRLAAHREAFADQMLQGWLDIVGVLEDDELAALIAAERKEEERWRSMIEG